MSRRDGTLGRVLPPVVALVMLLLAWELLVRWLEVRAFVVPPPSAVAKALWEGRGDLAASTGRTALSAAAGFAIAAVLGVLLGSVLTFSRWLERGIYPLTLFLQVVPLVAIAPLLAFWFKQGYGAVIAASAIVSIFPVIANTVAGLHATDPLLDELFRTCRASPWQRWTRLALPSAVPSIVTGLRVAAGLATIGAVVGEFQAAYGGSISPLGVVIVTQLRSFHTDTVFAAIALAAVVGFALFAVVGLLARLALGRWMGAD